MFFFVLLPGGIDKDCMARVSYLRPGGIAQRYGLITLIFWEMSGSQDSNLYVVSALYGFSLD